MNHLPADDSHVISSPIFRENENNVSQNLSSAALLIGALRVNIIYIAAPSKSALPMS